MSRSSPFPPRNQLPGTLHVGDAPSGSGVDEDSPSSLSDSHLYAHQSSIQNMLVSPLVPDTAAEAAYARIRHATGSAGDDDSQIHNDESRMTVAPQSCMSLRSTRTLPRCALMSHNPYSCSPSFLEIPVDAEDTSVIMSGVLGGTTTMMMPVHESSGAARGHSSVATLSAPEAALKVNNNNNNNNASSNANNNNLSAASVVRVHVKQRAARQSSVSTLMHTASPMNLSLDPSQLRTPDTASLAPQLPPHTAAHAAQGSRRTSALQQPYGQYADAYASAAAAGLDGRRKTLMSEDGEFCMSEGTEENCLTPRETVYDPQTDSHMPSPSTVPLTPEYIALMSTGGDHRAQIHHLNAVEGTHPTPSSAASEAPTSMSILSNKRRHRRHGRRGNHHPGKHGAAALDDLAPAMDLMYLPPPPPPLQHLTALHVSLTGTASTMESADAEAYRQFSQKVQRWYERVVQSERSYLISAYGGTGEVTRPCPRREQFVRDHGPGASGPAAVSALVAWVASADQWWVECVQPFSFTRRHQALPPAITAAAVAAAASTSRSGAGSSGHSMRRTSFPNRAPLTPLMVQSGASSASPGSPVQWMTPQSPAAGSAFSYSMSNAPRAMSPQSSGAASGSQPCAESYPVYQTSPYNCGYGGGSAASGQPWYYPQQQQQQQQQYYSYAGAPPSPAAPRQQQNGYARPPQGQWPSGANYSHQHQVLY